MTVDEFPKVMPLQFLPAASQRVPITNHQSPITNHQSPITSLLTPHSSLLTPHLHPPTLLCAFDRSQDHGEAVDIIRRASLGRRPTIERG
jgi:hypothetical protein